MLLLQAVLLMDTFWAPLCDVDGNIAIVLGDTDET